MRTAQDVFSEIKTTLVGIRTNGGHIDQYDTRLFSLFVEAYKDGHMNFTSSPRLTADAILDNLSGDANYLSITSKTTYNLNKSFHQKWRLWTDAFTKGFENGYIIWNK